MTPVLQLVLLGPQPQHGLRVPMELIVKVVQQGGPRPVLRDKNGLSPEGGQRCPPVRQPARPPPPPPRAPAAPWDPAAINCTGTVNALIPRDAAQAGAGVFGEGCREQGGGLWGGVLRAGRGALGRGAESGAGAGGQRYLQLRKLVRLAAGVLRVDELGQQELPELGALGGGRQGGKHQQRHRAPLVSALFNPTPEPPLGVGVWVQNPRRARGALLHWPSPWHGHRGPSSRATAATLHRPRGAMAHSLPPYHGPC